MYDGVAGCIVFGRLLLDFLALLAIGINLFLADPYLASLIIFTGRSEPTCSWLQRLTLPVSWKPHFSITRPEAGFSGK